MQEVMNTSSAPPRRVRLARNGLKILFVPVVGLTAISRMSPPRWFWIDIATAAGWVVIFLLAVAGRVFSKSEESSRPTR